MTKNSYCCVNELLMKTLHIFAFILLFLICFLSIGGFKSLTFTKVTVFTSGSLGYSSTSKNKGGTTRADDSSFLGYKGHSRKNLKHLQNIEGDEPVVDNFKGKSSESAFHTGNNSKEIQKPEIADTFNSTWLRKLGKIKGTLNITQSTKEGYTKGSLISTQPTKQEGFKGTIGSTQSIKLTERKERPNTNLEKPRNMEVAVHVNGMQIEYNERKLQELIGNISKNMYKKSKDDTCIKRYPGAAIVGVAKCGTRELSDFMRMHPYIVPKYYSRHYKLPMKYFTNISKFHNSIKDQMPCTYKDQIGTFKEDSAFMKPDMPRALHKINPAMKIIAMVREPVARIISQKTFRFEKTEHGPDYKLDFRRHLLENNSTEVRPGVTYVKLSTYSECLKRYLKYFPMSQILVIETEEFNKDPVAVLNRVQEFLGVKKFDFQNNFLINPETGFYCVKTKKSEKQSIVCYNRNRGRHIVPDLTDAEMQSLRDYFKPFNEELFQLLGQRFHEWEY